MIKLLLPVYVEHLYPTGEEEETYGYQKTGHEGILGEFHCSLCGKKFWSSEFDDFTSDDFDHQNIELDCECKKTWIGFEGYDEFEVEITNKANFPKMFQPFSKPGEKPTGAYIYEVYLNTSIVAGKYGGHSEQKRGTLGELECPQCLKKYTASTNGACQVDKDGDDIILCVNCNRTYVKRQKAIPNPKPIVYTEFIVNDGKVQTPSYTNNKGYLGDLTCGWCQQPFHFSRNVEGQPKITCKNCNCRTLLSESFIENMEKCQTYEEKQEQLKVSEEDTARPINCTITDKTDQELTEQQKEFIDNFFLIEEEEEIDEDDPLASFFQN